MTPLQKLTIAILFAAVLLAAHMAFSAIGTIHAGVCKPCSVVYCDACPEAIGYTGFQQADPQPNNFVIIDYGEPYGPYMQGQ